ncbi:MAG: apolipoprotein N-acyltransferase [Spirochaetes bacterium]|nr:apolipoprotein N-acyltransferase [Spirochaetota bacterium]
MNWRVDGRKTDPKKRHPLEDVPIGGEEVLLTLTGIGFLFSYIFAANANLDYVQWFIRSGGNLKLAPDSRTERAVAFVRYGPLLMGGFWVYIRNAEVRRPDSWRLPKVLFSSLLTTLSFPSFLQLDGYGALAWVALIPLFSVLFRSDRKAIVFYGTVYGTYTSTLINFWLGTFSLVSLLVIILIQGAFYFLFMMVCAPLLQRVKPLYRFVLVASLFTLFEYARSSGFLGYPWGLLGASQYQWPVVLQVAEITGVWGVSFLLFLWNAALAELWTESWEESSQRVRAILFSALLVVGALVYGGWILKEDMGLWTPSLPMKGGSVRIALIQQNTDPRKDEYRKTFEVLKRLTDEVLRSKESPVDLVVWSETAFVPNLRRWSREDPEKFELARLVRDFLAYQKTLGTYLITGNDDYEIVSKAGSEEVRKNYNAAVFFAPDGSIQGVYHKNKLVPFTEYFPYEKEFPWVYKALQSFDVHFWEPGTEQTVFQHPQFRFSTPICFEDVFPNLVRKFVLNGADLIVNISNDYWSLTPVEGKQHAIHSVLRAIENRRPLLRATASGWTLYSDPYGRIQSSLPLYEEGALLVEVPLGEVLQGRVEGQTFYTRYGDWFPLWCGGVIFLLILLTVWRKTSSSPARGYHRCFLGGLLG